MATIADSTSFKATAYRRDLARRLGVAGFGRWWSRELTALMPSVMRSAIERRRTRPVLMFDGNVATLWRPVQTGGRVQMTETTRIALDGDARAVAAVGRAALAPLAINGAAPQVVVALPPRAALRKTLMLPAALEDNLRQALLYDIDRHTPFKADELYFDAAVVDRDNARNALRVDLAAAQRTLVDPVLRHVDAFGARAIAVTVEPPATALTSPINLLPEDRRVPALDWTRWQVIVPGALVIAGLLAALILPVWQKREEAIALNQIADVAHERAASSDALRTQLERSIGDYNFALERKYAFPGVVQVLNDVTRILPDDTWLTQLEVHSGRGKDQQRELTLRGESANAGRLVSLLEDSKLFMQTAPRSPTTKIQPGPGEIFDVGAQLKPLPAPAALPIDTTAPPPRTIAASPRAATPVPTAAAESAAAPQAAAGASSNGRALARSASGRPGAASAGVAPRSAQPEATAAAPASGSVFGPLPNPAPAAVPNPAPNPAPSQPAEGEPPPPPDDGDSAPAPEKSE